MRDWIELAWIVVMAVVGALVIFVVYGEMR
jgi:hypothetical protein